MISIVDVKSEDTGALIKLVKNLLEELGDEASDIQKLDAQHIAEIINKDPVRHIAYFAFNEDKEVVGFVTIEETFSIYAGGYFGVINEMYVKAEFRSHQIGKMLVDKVKELAKEKSWPRIDVTAPTEPKWDRTVKFYESQGFIFTGPKMKFVL